MKMMRLMGAVQGLLFGLFLSVAHSSVAQDYATTDPTIASIPVVTIRAVDPQATWGGNPGVFAVIRDGNPVPPLYVYYEISGTASNGLDYKRIGNWVDIPSGVRFGEVVIRPIAGSATTAVTKTVVLTLTNSPLMTPIGASMPVNYIIGSPNRDTVYIGPGIRTNVPPRVAVVYPADGSVFYTPPRIPIVASANDLDGFVRSVEFFDGDLSLGTVTNPVTVLPPLDGVVPPTPPMPPYQPFVLMWSNPPFGDHVLTARATDNEGASGRSLPVHVSVLSGSPPPPTNYPPVVRITSPANNSILRAPLNLPLVAFAADRDGSVTNVQFFAGVTNLGAAHRVAATPGATPPPNASVLPSSYWLLVWSNTPPGDYPLTAVATDNRGASAVSPPVHVTILPYLPPPTVTNIVGIFATDPIAVEGTNCWPWLGLAGSPLTWDNWTATAAVCRYFTNCGPKSAVFTVRRLGETNASLVVPYAIGGTASNGVDYVLLPGNVTIPAGQRAAMIVVAPIDDGLPDVTRTVILKLIPSAAYVVDPQHSVAAAIILDHPTPSPVATALPDRCLRIHSAGPDGAWVKIESTTDLRNWSPICTNQVVNGSVEFIDPDPQTGQLRFYRSVPDAGLLQ